MLNIVVINCDGKQVEYEWDSVEDFILALDSDNEIIPMLDDYLVKLDSDSENLNLWWSLTDYNTVYDLYEDCKQEMCL